MRDNVAKTYISLKNQFIFPSSAFLPRSRATLYKHLKHGLRRHAVSVCPSVYRFRETKQKEMWLPG